MSGGSATFEAALQHHRAGQLDEAEQLYRRALGEDPRNANAAFLLGALALEAGRVTAALGSLRLATRIDPTHAAAHSNMGEAYRRLGKMPDAVACFARALQLRPELAETAYNLGLALQAAGEPGAAVAFLEHAAHELPGIAAIRETLQQARSAVDGAAGKASSRRTTLPPETFLELAELNHLFGDLNAAITMCRRALALDRGAHSSSGRKRLSRLLVEAGHLDEAIECLRDVLARHRDDREAMGLLVDACLTSGLVGDAVPELRRCLVVLEHPQLRALLLLTMAYDPNSDDDAIRREAAEWDRLYGTPFSARAKPHANEPSRDRRLRIGYVSSFKDGGHRHFLGPLWQNHDKGRFEVFCYSSALVTDSDLERLRPCIDTWRDTATIDDEALAALIRSDRIDVLVDLNMHTTGNRLLVFARRPAPVQLCWLAYPGTTGLSAMDYRVTDPYLDTPGDDATACTERSLCLPHAFWCYESGGSIPEVSALPAATAGRVTFGCLNSHTKLNEAVFAVWAHILDAAPAARLVLLAPANDMRRRILATFAGHGIDAARMTFFDTAPRQEYLARYHGIDVCLDPFPCCGHTTSLDSFWMGVPVVTLRSPNKIVGRAGASLATNLGLPELIADAPEDYVRIAVGLCGDLDRLSSLRGELRSRLAASPLMDGPRFASNMEALYRDAWSEWCDRQPKSDP
ncbi:MAG: tetratricopeptide repeat protein [Polyangiaceae bacterium]